MAFTLLAFAKSASAQNADSLEVLRLHSQFEQLMQRNQESEALKTAARAAELSEQLGDNLLKGKSYYYQARSKEQSGNYATALNHYLQAVYSLEKAAAGQELALAYQHLGDLYARQNIHERAILYLNKALKAWSANDPCLPCQESLGKSQLATEQYEEAYDTYTGLLPQYEREKRYEALSNVQGQLAFISQAQGKYEQAFAHGAKRIEYAQKAGNARALGNAYNNMGFASKHLGKTNKAINYFEKALDAFREVPEQGRQDISIWVNMGVAHDQLAQHKQAVTAYRRALEIAQKHSDEPSLLGESHNYLAASYFVANNKAKALEQLDKAVRASKKEGDLASLAESYGIYAEVYRYDERFRESQRYDRLKQELEERIAAQQARQKEAKLESLLEAERRENEYLSLIAEKERQALSLRQLSLEKEKLQLEKASLEKEQQVLEQEQELQKASLKNERLASQQAQQALLLTQRQLDAEQQKRAIAALEATQEKQRLELAQKALEEKERQKAMALLESEKQLQDERLAKEEASRRFSYWIFSLFALLFIIVVFSFVQQRKASKKQKKQAEEIKLKNEELLASEEELRQNMEELETTQETLQHQKDRLEVTYQQLEAKSESVTSSIRYAETIQTAILPNADQLAQAFKDYMVLYLPKDIVSGDFYWLSQQQGYTFIVVADCTGHGVPGAFMSMIGHALLSQIINEKDLFDPAKILDELNIGVIKALKQRDTTNSDGMDLSIGRLKPLEDGRWEMQYSGAKSKILILNKEGLSAIRSDNLSIGGLRRKKADKPFSSQKIILEKGDVVYMMTDGYVDTANASRRRIGTPQLMKAVERIKDLPLEKQKEQLLDMLRRYQGDVPQRDDITILAFKV